MLLRKWIEKCAERPFERKAKFLWFQKWFRVEPRTYRLVAAVCSTCSNGAKEQLMCGTFLAFFHLLCCRSCRIPGQWDTDVQLINWKAISFNLPCTCPSFGDAYASKYPRGGLVRLSRADYAHTERMVAWKGYLRHFCCLSCLTAIMQRWHALSLFPVS